jgi:hypothetical protein
MCVYIYTHTHKYISNNNARIFLAGSRTAQYSNWSPGWLFRGSNPAKSKKSFSSIASSPALEPTQYPIQFVPGFLPRSKVTEAWSWQLPYSSRRAQLRRCYSFSPSSSGPEQTELCLFHRTKLIAKISSCWSELNTLRDLMLQSESTCSVD